MLAFPKSATSVANPRLASPASSISMTVCLRTQPHSMSGRSAAIPRLSRYNSAAATPGSCSRSLSGAPVPALPNTSGRLLPAWNLARSRCPPLSTTLPAVAVRGDLRLLSSPPCRRGLATTPVLLAGGKKTPQVKPGAKPGAKPGGAKYQPGRGRFGAASSPSAGPSKKKKKKKKGQSERLPEAALRARNLRKGLHSPAPPPLRMARNRWLRHWTIHRAWLLYQRKLRRTRRGELLRLYQSMSRACEELRNTSGPGGKEVGHLYRVATLNRGVYQPWGIPIDYVRHQTETPARTPWNHEWQR